MVNKMKNKKYVFKPDDQLHTLYWFTWLIVFIPFDLGLIFMPFRLGLLIAVLCMNGIPTLTFLLVRLLYNIRYVIDEHYLIKYKGKEIVFKVPIGDLDAVSIQKAKFPLLKLWYRVTPYGHTEEKDLTCLYFVSRKCEVLKQEAKENAYESISNRSTPSFFRQREFFSFHKCKRICRALGMKPILMEKNK